MAGPLQLAVACLLGATALSALADVVVLQPARDTTVFADNVVHASGSGDLFIGSTAGGQPRRALLRFDLSAIGAGFVVTEASLSMSVTRSSGGAPNSVTALHRIEADWGEAASNVGGSGGGDSARPGDATWTLRFFGDPASAWARPGGDYADVPSASATLGGTDRYTWTGPGLVADLNAWLANPASNFGWIAIGDETESATARRVPSREAVSAFQRPELVLALAPIPEPSTYWLLGAGLLVISSWAKRRA